MSDFLETLRQRLQEAQQKYQVAQHKLNIANAEHQAAAQEFNAWQVLVASETRKVQQSTGENPAQPTPNASQASLASGNKSEGNKTEAVRELLRSHPGGMTPGDIWQAMESQMKNRAYLYSVLKRLKDRGDARERRGKYFPNPKLEENPNQTFVQ